MRGDNTSDNMEVTSEVTTQATTCESVEGAYVKGVNTGEPQEVIPNEIAKRMPSQELNGMQA